MVWEVNSDIAPNFILYEKHWTAIFWGGFHCGGFSFTMVLHKHQDMITWYSVKIANPNLAQKQQFCAWILQIYLGFGLLFRNLLTPNLDYYTNPLCQLSGPPKLARGDKGGNTSASKRRICDGPTVDHAGGRWFDFEEGLEGFQRNFGLWDSVWMMELEFQWSFSGFSDGDDDFDDGNDDEYGTIVLLRTIGCVDGSSWANGYPLRN